MTWQDLHGEMLEDLLLRQADLRERLAENGTSSGLLDELNAVNRALGEKEAVADSLWDKWEADLAAGRTPDLDEMPPEP